SANVPALTCTPSSPLIFSTTSCTTTLSVPLPAGSSLQVQVSSPVGAFALACSGTTGGLVCGTTGATTVTLTCGVPNSTTPCPLGSAFTLQIYSPAAGPIQESLTFNLAGAAPLVVTLVP